MKTNKIISIIISICIVISVLSFGAVSVSAVPGGWEFSDIAADNVTAEEQAVFDKALEGLEGSDYTAKDVIATQLVAGKNYAFLCIKTPVVPDPISEWAVVTVYEDFEGNVEMTNIETIEPADVKTMDNIPEDGAGGIWKCSPKENAASLPENVQNALDMNEGVSLSAIAVLGTQLVSGTNYCILAYGTLVTANPVTYLYEVDVYSDTAGNAEITSVSVFDIGAYTTPESSDDPTDDPTDESSDIIGGYWKFSDLSAENVTEEEQTVFDKAMESFDGVDYEPKDVIATQTVSGTNYAFLCIDTVVYPGAEPHWSIVTVYEDLQENAEVTNIVNIDISDIKTLENISEKNMGGSWKSVSKEGAVPLPEAVKAALDRNDGVSLSSIAVLGTQVVAGTNYRLLVYGNLITAEPRTDLYVVDVYENLDGEAEITSIAPFDLLAYVEKKNDDPVDEPIDDPVDEPIDDPVDDPIEEPVDKPYDKPAEDDKPSVPDTSTNDSTPSETSAPNIVPTTGSNDVIAFTVIVMLLAGAAAASACTMRKKQR